MLKLCEYRDILGRPGEGVHSIRFMNIAVVDVVLTLMAAVWLSKIFKLKSGWATVLMFLLGIIMHRVFCVETTVDRWLFNNQQKSI